MNFSRIAITFRSHSFSDGRLKGSGGGVAIRFAATLTNRVMSGPDGCPANGSFDASLIMSRAGQIIISHLNGNFFAIAARRADSLTSLRTTNVPTAPMLITPSFDNWLAITAGWQRFALPTFTPRKNTTRRIWELPMRGHQGSVSNSLPNELFSTRLRKWS